MLRLLSCAPAPVRVAKLLPPESEVKYSLVEEGVDAIGNDATKPEKHGEKVGNGKWGRLVLTACNTQNGVKAVPL